MTNELTRTRNTMIALHIKGAKEAIEQGNACDDDNKRADWYSFAIDELNAANRWLKGIYSK